ncbi:MAG: ASKHA domain-containing protein [Syntrophomonadaceae bacterium]|jgi:uncharacterized 2Fe-2S/4Fe-4S cluster protein (DUF4445 family)
MDELVKIEIFYNEQPPNSIWAYPGQNLWESLVANGLASAGPCGGLGICGKCKVKVKGHVKPPDEEERYLLLPEEVKAGLRLACHIPVSDGLQVFLETQPLLTASVPEPGSPSDFQAMAVHKKIYLPGHDSQNPVSIQERLQQALPEVQIDLTIDNLNDLYRLDRVDRPVLELNALLLKEQRLIYAGKSRRSLYGVALDIGTTSLVGSFIDLATGAALWTSTMPNMQRIYGADIVSRLQYANEHDDGLQTLHQVIINNVNAMIADMAEQSGSKPEQVYQVVAVGNPVMIHLFLGLNPLGLAAAPFAGIITDAFTCQAAELGLVAYRDAKVHIPPPGGSFIGSDALVGLLTLPNPSPLPYLYIDIGTNGEVILADNTGMWAASAAAGPAFEGAGIRCGMRASLGAIDHFQWDGGQLDYRVLGKVEPRGMCGSALIDLLAFLLERGMVDRAGSLVPGEHELAIRSSPQGYELIIVPPEQAYQGIPVVLSQEDLRQIQLAKGALRSAIEILLQESGLKADELRAIYLAGAFGNYLQAEHAIKIGLLPAVKVSLIHNIGNAAGRGAMHYLTRDRARRQVSHFKQALNCIELANHRDFQPIFLQHVNFA